MDILNNLITGFTAAGTLQNVGFAMIGCLVGTLIGVLPGVGPVATIAMDFEVVTGEPCGNDALKLLCVHGDVSSGFCSRCAANAAPPRTLTATQHPPPHNSARATHLSDQKIRIENRQSCRRKD